MTTIYNLPTLDTCVCIYVNGNGLPPIHFQNMTWSQWTHFKQHVLPTAAYQNWRDHGTGLVKAGWNGKDSYLVKHFSVDGK